MFTDSSTNENRKNAKYSCESFTRTCNARDNDEKPSPEPMPDLRPKKRMLSVWWDREGPIYLELLDSNVHVTMAY